MDILTLSMMAASSTLFYKWATGSKKKASVAPAKNAQPEGPPSVVPTDIQKEIATAPPVVVPPVVVPPVVVASPPVVTPSLPTVAPYLVVDGRPIVGGISGTVASSKAPSSPNFQWYWLVMYGQSPALIARLITGTECDYLELLDANPNKATTGNRVCYKINFVSLLPGEYLALPKSWNHYIAVDGSRRDDGQKWTGTT